MTCEYRPAPCATCPFRRATKLALWHKSQFEALAERDANQFGAEFGCHEDDGKPNADVGPCIGWLLDQKRRNVPAIALRMRLVTNAAAAEHFERIGDAGPELYDSLEEMFAANKKADDALRRKAKREGYTIRGVKKPERRRT